MRRSFILALATIVFVGCVKDMTNDVAVGLGGKRYYATIAPIESRVQLNSQKQTVWNTGDEIVIFTPDNTIQIASFDGKTGDRDGSFTTTRIPLKNIFDSAPVSRSQAKRICNRLESFEEVILDFEDVSWMGQGFAHQIFVVYQNLHPTISIKPIHMSPDVESMYLHVIKSS